MSHDYLNANISETAARLPEQRLELAKAEFAKIDLNQDGKVTLEEFIAFTLAKEVKRLMHKFQAADTDQDGAIEFEEFLAVTVPHYALLKKFAAFDADGDGRLSLDEAAAIVDKLVIPLEQSDLEIQLQKVDHNRDGLVSYEEFLGIVVHHGMQ